MTKLQMKNSTDTPLSREIYIHKEESFLKFQRKSRFVKKNCKNVGGARFLAFSIYT